jgi:hypothetical protein
MATNRLASSITPAIEAINIQVVKNKKAPRLRLALFYL